MQGDLNLLAARAPDGDWRLVDMTMEEHEAAVVSPGVALRRTRQLLPLVHDLVVDSADAEDGVSLEKNYIGGLIFELFVWGRSLTPGVR